MEKKKNSVNLTEKKPKNSEIKKEINEEENNKKIVVVALILALILAIIAYWQISKKDEVKKPKNNKNNEVVEKKDDKKDEEKDTKEDNSDNDLSYNNTTEPTKVMNTSEDITTPEKVNEENEENEEEEQEEIYYSLVFNTNGGKEVDKQVLSDTDKTESVLPEKDGWSFAGWFTDSSLSEEFIFGRVLTEDTTLYAKWVKVVEFRKMDETVLNSVEVQEDSEIPLLTKEQLGEDVDSEKEVSWVLRTVDDEGNTLYNEVTSGTKLTEDISSENGKVTLYLKELEKFEIQIFMNENDNEPFDVIEATEERVLDLTSLEEKLKEEDIVEYALFYRNENRVKYTFFKDQKASLDITKLYLDEAYIVTFKDYKENEIENNETEVPTETSEVQSNEKEAVVIEEIEVAKETHIKEEEIPTTEKEGFDFVGWYEDLEDESTVLTEETVIDEDKVYVAKWKKKEEIIEDTVGENSVTPNEEEQIENTEEPSDNNDEQHEEIEQGLGE